MPQKKATSLPSSPVSLQDVTICRHENEILHGVNLEIKAGDLIYITGPVGSGKSSLLELIYGELKHTQGKAYVLGYDLSKLKLKQRQAMRRRMGIVFQSSDQLLYDRNVEKNLDFVLRSTGTKDRVERKQRIEEALRKVGMSGKGYRMAHELSGGEAERICIARALIVNPSLIILDEPTKGLDSETAHSIGQLIKSIADMGTAVLMSTHNEELVAAIPSTTYRIDSSARTLRLLGEERNRQDEENTFLEDEVPLSSEI